MKLCRADECGIIECPKAGTRYWKEVSCSHWLTPNVWRTGGRRGEVSETLQIRWVFPPPSGRPHNPIWNMCGMELGEEEFSPKLTLDTRGFILCLFLFFLSCLLLQSQCLSHLDHFLDYIAHKVRKRGESKTNKTKFLSAFSLWDMHRCKKAQAWLSHTGEWRKLKSLILPWEIRQTLFCLNSIKQDGVRQSGWTKEELLLSWHTFCTRDTYTNPSMGNEQSGI